MRYPGHAASGLADYGYGIACKARRCVWPARSTPLNWEPFDFAHRSCRHYSRHERCETAGQPVSVCETAAQKRNAPGLSWQGLPAF
jgi:hypothetical protein